MVCRCAAADGQKRVSEGRINRLDEAQSPQADYSRNIRPLKRTKQERIFNRGVCGGSLQLEIAENRLKHSEEGVWPARKLAFSRLPRSRRGIFLLPSI